jgi:hypothetical protein
MTEENNFLFPRPERRARTSCILMTIVDIAFMNYIDSQGYMEFLLDNYDKLPFEDLLTWSNKISESIRISKKNTIV